MKKILAIIGGVVAATSIIAIAAVILKKIKFSFCIESADDEFDFDPDGVGDISVSIDESLKDDEEDETSEDETPAKE